MGRGNGGVGSTAATPAAQVDILRRDDALVAVLTGEWNLERPAPRFDALIEAALAAPGPGGATYRLLSFDATGLGAWDSRLLIFLLRGLDACEAHALEVDRSGLPEQVVRLLDLARAVPERIATDEGPRPGRLARLGHATLSVWDSSLAAVTFAGEVAAAISRLPMGRARMRWRDFWVVVQSNGSGALPIVTLIALLVGVIVAFLGVVVLQRFGAGYYVSYLVGYGMLRELGALMTGIIMAGRTGAGFAAELGSMKISEEVDALSTLGVSPIEHLVLPRVLGLFVMMPLLVVYADFVGIVGGMWVAVTMLDASATQFVGGLLSVVTLSDALLGVVKATAFGLLIGLAGCMKGLGTGTDAGAVGRSATSAVVLGITLIIAANAVFDWLAAVLHL